MNSSEANSAAHRSQPSPSPKPSAVPKPAPTPKEPEPLQLPVQQDANAFRDALRLYVQFTLIRLGSDTKERKSSPMFIFTRELMRFNLPQNLRDYPNDFADLLEKLHGEWRERLWAKDEIDPDFWGANADKFKGEDRDGFLSTWSNTADPPGADPLLAAWARARTDPMMNTHIPGKSREYVELLVMAKQLQVIVGDQNILLPQDRLAEILVSSQPAMSRYISAAGRDGYLLLVRPADHAEQQAAEYRYVFERAKRPAAAKKSPTGTKNVN